MCPCCDRDDLLESRDRLESMIRRGGKQGRRISRAVRDLDERFERATSPTDTVNDGSGWWHRRDAQP